jgi:double-strand break repair protein MRE11
MREIVLADVDRFKRKASDKGKEAVIKYLREQVCPWQFMLTRQVEEAIEEANEQWLESQAADSQDLTPPLPLIRLRVEHSGPFEVENPQRFSNKFVGKVANTTDVVQFYRKKKLGTTKRASATIIDDAEIEENEDSQDRIIRVEALVKEFLSAQTLSVLEENGLGEAIESFVDKDDKRALADFIDDTLKEHVDVTPIIP